MALAPGWQGHTGVLRGPGSSLGTAGGVGGAGMPEGLWAWQDRACPEGQGQGQRGWDMGCHLWHGQGSAGQSPWSPPQLHHHPPTYRPDTSINPHLLHHPVPSSIAPSPTATGACPHRWCQGGSPRCWYLGRAHPRDSNRGITAASLCTVALPALLPPPLTEAPPQVCKCC